MKQRRVWTVLIVVVLIGLVFQLDFTTLMNHPRVRMTLSAIRHEMGEEGGRWLPWSHNADHLQHLEQRLTRLRDDLREQERLSVRVKRLEGLYRELDVLALRMQRVEGMKKELSALAGRLQRAEGMKNDIHTLTSRQQRAEEMKGEITALTSRLQRAEGMKSEINALTNRLQRAEGLRGEMVALSSGVNGQMASLRGDLSMLSGRLSALEGMEKRLQSLETASRPDEGHIESGSVLAKKLDEGWKLSNVFTKERRFQQRVHFSRPFAKPPGLFVGISQLDMSQEKMWIHAYADKVDEQGFTLEIKTRSETRIEEVRTEWLAFPDTVAK